ncbi:hypothetical protein CD30_13575 [Ureibacillus massiliensis 4400831 = CIP 108448 = CCUG 49529]|uniref:6-hydroxymethylpterin diphosphokinase MptE-like domain-containing protein n=2 Tax=cellular organisms TaxID=131567 RepID=A0A0A3J4I6_9BACL|nr:6-hydroxymethylpterin diphosphokinase MptE-like protein [Ureibacillus massiliensis]KGR90088.1 hypothetical protein CD30_13575 [Ureibacillus massiliensis 4400831 = CIP 108448 = CCUG 49529]
MNVHQVERLTAKSGVPTLKINDYYIHSKYDPIREAQQIAERQYTPHHAHIIFGYGCGYLVDALLSCFKHNEELLVVDPLFNERHIDINEKHIGLKIYESTILNNFEFYLGAVAKEVRTAYKTICLPNYEKLFPEDYKLLLSKIKDVQYRVLVNDYTLIRYARDWHMNFMGNLINLKKDANIKTLRQVYDCPVVIASGGPSLNKQLDLLKSVRDNIILIAAGSTINSLIAEGIEPDYVVSIDGGIPNYKHFQNLKLENAQLIYTMQSHPGVRDAFLNDCFVTGINGFDAVTEYMEKQLGIDLPVFISGGTVAHLAFNMALYISSGPVALIGQDLAYTDNLTHAAHNINARPIDDKFIKEKEAFQTEGYYGELVWTTKPFYSMKLEFEELVKLGNPDVPFFNCTEGGIKLEGFDQITFKDFVQQFVTEEKVNIYKVDRSEKLDFDLIDAIKQDIKNYRKLIGLYTDGLKTLNSNKFNTKFEQSILNKLDKIDNKIAKVLSFVPLDSMMAPIKMQVMRGFLEKENETVEEAYKRAYAQTETLYKKLLNITKFAKEYAEKVLNDFKEKEGEA